MEPWAARPSTSMGGSMPITFNKLTALAILRSIRTGSAIFPERRCFTELAEPSPTTGRHWTCKRMLEELPETLGKALARETVYVAVPRQQARIKVSDTRNTVHAKQLPKHSFVGLGDTIAVPTPELLFLEMRTELDTLGLALLGMELCGRYSLPRNGVGDPTYGIKQVTTARKLRDYVGAVSRLPGLDHARRAVDLIRDNCWSPMEAPLVAFAGDGPDGLGYGIGDVIVNERKGANKPDLASKASRVPDLMFEGTTVGINYDGSGHYDLGRVIRAAIAAGSSAGDGGIWEELELTKTAVRAKYADDRRRERDLWVDGLTVFTATKEDLYEEGALDLLMGQVIEAIERTSGRDMATQREALRDPGRATRRRELLKSALP